MNWAYLVRCRDGTLYAGWTNALERRLTAHHSGTGAKYTRGRGPVRLVYAQSCPTKSKAMAREAELKRLTRPQKEALAAEWAAANPTGEAPQVLCQKEQDETT